MPANTQLHWRQLQPDEAEAAFRLHLEAIANQAPGLVRPDDITHFVGHTNDAGRILACFTPHNQMVAYGVLGLASTTVSHMAELLHVGADARQRFAILDGVASLEEWRGLGLHRASIQHRVEAARSCGRNLIGATVAPGNGASLRGLLDCGFTVRGFAELYGGLPRLLMLRDLAQPVDAWEEYATVALSDQAGHCQALDQGWQGYAGVELEAGAWFVRYGIPV
jgi:hypothetical protein